MKSGKEGKLLEQFEMSENKKITKNYLSNQLFQHEK